jgi:hypothetical protein
MATVPETPTTRNFGRRSYGAHRSMTPAQKAHNVATSIQQRTVEGHPWTWSDYGLTPDSAQADLVRHALASYPCGA